MSCPDSCQRRVWSIPNGASSYGESVDIVRVQGANPQHAVHSMEGPLLPCVGLSDVDLVVLEPAVDVDAWGRQPVEGYEGGALGYGYVHTRGG